MKNCYVQTLGAFTVPDVAAILRKLNIGQSCLRSQLWLSCNTGCTLALPEVAFGCYLTFRGSGKSATLREEIRLKE